MYTIVGLGNPGGEYAKTRHNTGRILAEKLAEEGNIELKEKRKPDLLAGTGTLFEEKVRIVLPNTFMNKSGAALTPYIKNVSAAKKLVVIYDDIDLPLGKVRVSVGSSSGGHNGIKSIERAIKTKDYIKVRVGVSKAGKKGAKKPAGEQATLNHLLGAFTKAELEDLNDEIYERISHALDTIFTTGDPVMGMNAVNGLPAL